MTLDEIKAHEAKTGCKNAGYEAGGLGWHCHDCGAGGNCGSAPLGPCDAQRIRLTVVWTLLYVYEEGQAVEGVFEAPEDARFRAEELEAKRSGQCLTATWKRGGEEVWRWDVPGDRSASYYVQPHKVQPPRDRMAVQGAPCEGQQ